MGPWRTGTVFPTLIILIIGIGISLLEMTSAGFGLNSRNDLNSKPFCDLHCTKCVNSTCICDPEVSGLIPTFERGGGTCGGILGKPAIDGLCQHSYYAIKNGICTCKEPEFYEYRGKCFQSYGAKCSLEAELVEDEPENCGPLFTCIDGKCGCNSTTQLVKNLEWLPMCISRVGSRCENASFCVEMAECVKIDERSGFGECSCVVGYLESSGLCLESGSASATSHLFGIFFLYGLSALMII